ncbi:MAG: HAD-IB family hydrolase [Clostridiales bacterium]|nr:HAD-IB family hydrolase [Clostridiales bacterium]
MRIALFDFDGTLCPGDSIVPYLRFCIRKGFAPPTQWFRAAGGYLHQRLHPDSVSEAKAESLSFIRGREKAEMDGIAEQFIGECLQPRFYSEGIETMQRLRGEGLKVILLSASASVYMDKMIDFLQVDAVISTQCELDSHNRYTGAVGPNCRDEEKLRRLHAWANGQELEIVTAFGDSAHDIPMLAQAEKPVWVNPSSTLTGQVQGEIVRWKRGRNQV